MRALKYRVTIGKDHRLVLTVPEAEGPAEVIVLVDEAQVTDGVPLGEHMRQVLQKPGGRSREEIDRDLEEERASWD